MTEEVWKSIPGLDGLYQVSTLGRVKGLSRDVSARNRWGTITVHHLPERLIKGGIQKDGYVRVDFGWYGCYSIHYLVLTTFVGPQPMGMESRHLDGNRQNNSLKNLAWGTPTQNNRDKIRHGTITRGEKVNTAKITEGQAREIRRVMNTPLDPGRKRRKRGSVAALAKKYKISGNAIHLIASGRNWGYLK